MTLRILFGYNLIYDLRFWIYDYPPLFDQIVNRISKIVNQIPIFVTGGKFMRQKVA